jgi:hypothetical protein
MPKTNAVISFPTVEEVMQMKVPELKSVILQHPHLTDYPQDQRFSTKKLITTINNHNHTLSKKVYFQKGLFTIKYETPTELTYRCTCYKLDLTGDWTNFKACTKQLVSLARNDQRNQSIPFTTVLPP